MSMKVVYVQCCVVVTWLVPHETAAVLAHSVHTNTTMHHVTSLHAKPYIHRVHACLAVTCHLHYWQNDLGPTAVTQAWYGYQNKSQHRN